MISVNPSEMFGNSSLFNLKSSGSGNKLSDISIDLRTLIILSIIIGLAAYGLMYHNGIAIFTALIGVLIYVK